MSTLQQIAQADPQWSLDDFVAVVNDLLPQFLPEADSPQKVQETVNPRLVRHYTTQGLVDRPLKAGREARYIYRHLLQLLVVRRLLMEGYSAGSLLNLMAEKTNTELEALLQGGAQLTVETSNPALAFLQEIRQREPPSSLQVSPSPTYKKYHAQAPAERNRRLAAYAKAVLPPTATQWTRLEVLPGLEIQVRDDFKLPTSSQETDNLLQLIAQHFHELKQARRPPK